MKQSIKKINVKTYFTGIQPTGEPHLGNYLGFIKNILHIQETSPSSTKIILSVVDLHGITTKLKPKDEMKDNITKMFTSLIACGVNPERTVLFKQSDVLEHTQLSWILSSCQSINKLERQPQYKDKIKQYSQRNIPLGLLSYPVLQTADVLLYKGTHVPVGEDQIGHMNLMIDLARKFNKITNNEYFPIPEAVLSNLGRVKSLRDPSKKMSKSDAQEFSRISICDKEDIIRKKIQKAVTDGIREIYYDDVNRPGISNLIRMVSSFTNQTIEEVVEDVKNLNTVQFKTYVSDKIVNELTPIQERYNELMVKPDVVTDIVVNGGNTARGIASRTLKDIKEIIGLN
uniref:tryptophan--tRNA ligase n=1 Tax=Parastrongyloides trichosuri TaxID=131310 RepID=A0A0N4ZYD1_PARTI